MRLWRQRLTMAGLALCMALGTVDLFDASLSQAATSAQVTEAGNAIELKYVGEDGTSTKEVLPLHCDAGGGHHQGHQDGYGGSNPQ